ncbi:MAG: protein prkA [Firmicutes bacterium]|nr:protein prkA [Bacillota bacterium]
MTLLNDYLSPEPEPEGWKGTFAEYFPKVLENPRLARGAHALLHDAILAAGVSEPSAGEAPDGTAPPRRYRMFEREIFGLDDVLDQIVRVIEAGARGLDIRRRILLLVGPPGSAKSTIVTLLKRRLEAYTRTPEGAVYAIAGCPLHEDPLHLLNPTARERLRRETGIVVEGDLCPVCQHRLANEWEGDVARVPVERIVFSEQARVGIATFAPSDPNVQDVSDLVGSMDLVKLQEFGVESHPLAWRFDGALDVANRGIFEGIELLKSKSELLFTLLTVAQERQIKTGRFALVYADMVLLAHTNEAEFQRFVAERRNEALQSRTYVIRVPYNLRWSDEVRIYEKLLAESSVRGHVAPWTLKAAAAWALLSRYEKNEKYPPALKLKLYDGQFEGEYRPAHAQEAREQSPRDGMRGVSPRQVINALAQALVAAKVPCIHPVDALKALRESLAHHAGAETKEESEALVAALAEVRKEYDDWAVKTVSRAFIAAFDDAAQDILKKYLDMAEASLRNDRIRDPVTGEWVEPDEKFMRSLEDLIGVSAAARKSFREELMVRVAGSLRRGETFRYDSHPKLKQAIEARLFADLQGTIRTTVSSKIPDEDQRARLREVKERLIAREGFCEHCAEAILQYVGYLLERR